MTCRHSTGHFLLSSIPYFRFSRSNFSSRKGQSSSIVAAVDPPPIRLWISPPEYTAKAYSGVITGAVVKSVQLSSSGPTINTIIKKPHTAQKIFCSQGFPAKGRFL